jgi:alkylation response protein AidB-like acyl-CoA dehydrogenase
MPAKTDGMTLFLTDLDRSGVDIRPIPKNAEEYHVARYFREARLMKIAPVSQEMIPNFLGSHVLGMPRSY